MDEKAGASRKWGPFAILLTHSIRAPRFFHLERNRVRLAATDLHTRSVGSLKARAQMSWKKIEGSMVAPLAGSRGRKRASEERRKEGRLR